MFDLPTVTAANRRHYRQFVKFIKSLGFIMFQESVYVKLSVNEAAIQRMRKNLEVHLPPHGMVSLLTVTEKQFAAMEYLVGECRSDVISTEERVLVL